jgi:predicted nucleic acid-binding protein
MKNKAHDLKTYRFSPGEEVLVDANVWLYLYPPPMNTSTTFARQYSTGFAQMINHGARPVLDPIILSEYLNRYCRIVWSGQFQSLYPKFKDFRNSSDFKTVAGTAGIFARRILGFCLVHDMPCNELDLHQAVADFESASLDFNDAVLADICKKYNFKFLTNDGDFQFGGVEVLTTNPRLLNA